MNQPAFASCGHTYMRHALSLSGSGPWTAWTSAWPLGCVECHFQQCCNRRWSCHPQHRSGSGPEADASPASPPHNHHHTNSCSKGDCASHIQQWCVEIQYVQVPALSLQCCGVTKPTLHYQRKGPPTGGNGGLRAGCWTIRHTTPATHNQAAVEPVVGPWTQRTSLFSAA